MVSSTYIIVDGPLGLLRGFVDGPLGLLRGFDLLGEQEVADRESVGPFQKIGIANELFDRRCEHAAIVGALASSGAGSREVYDQVRARRGDSPLVVADFDRKERGQDSRHGGKAREGEFFAYVQPPPRLTHPSLPARKLSDQKAPVCTTQVLVQVDGEVGRAIENGNLLASTPDSEAQRRSERVSPGLRPERHEAVRVAVLGEIDHEAPRERGEGGESWRVYDGHLYELFPVELSLIHRSLSGVVGVDRETTHLNATIQRPITKTQDGTLSTERQFIFSKFANGD